MEAVKLRRCSLSLRRQCELLCIPRSSLYYAPIPGKPENLKIMLLMNTHLTCHPTEGVLSMVDWLQVRGYPVGPKRVRRMFKLMGHETSYRRKNLTKGALRAYIKPYLLRGLKIDRANQVWCTDITYIRMARGFVYITAYIDVYSRKIKGWGISNSMSKQWCMDILEVAIAENGVPEIINSDQATDNIWIERFWKTIKYNHIYLNPCDTGLELYEGVQIYFDYYNQKKHQGTGMKPNDAYYKSLNQNAA